MIVKNELRIGNVLNYTTADGDILPTTLDWQDLKWISEDKKGFNLVHDSIPLTEEIILKCGFEKYRNIRFKHRKLEGLYILKVIGFYMSNVLHEVKYLHQLQNLYFALTGEELKINL